MAAVVMYASISFRRMWNQISRGMTQFTGEALAAKYAGHRVTVTGVPYICRGVSGEFPISLRRSRRSLYRAARAGALLRSMRSK